MKCRKDVVAYFVAMLVMFLFGLLGVAMFIKGPELITVTWLAFTVAIVGGLIAVVSFAMTVMIAVDLTNG